MAKLLNAERRVVGAGVLVLLLLATSDIEQGVMLPLVACLPASLLIDNNCPALPLSPMYLFFSLFRRFHHL